MKKIAVLLVLIVVLAACDSTPPTPTLQDRANATKTVAEAAAIQSDAADKAKIAQANAALARQQSENEKLLAQTKAAGDKALANATAYGKAYQDRVNANKTAAEIDNANQRVALENNLAIARGNLQRQESENFSYGLRLFLYQAKPWFVFIAVLLLTQFVVSVGQYWWVRTYANQPRVLSQPTTLGLLLAKYAGLPISWIYYIAGFIFGWQLWRTRDGWQMKQLHESSTIRLLAKSEAGKRLVAGALQQMGALVPGLAARASDVIARSGENAVALLDDEKDE